MRSLHWLMPLTLAVASLSTGCRSQEQLEEQATVQVHGVWEGREGSFLGVAYKKCPTIIDYVRLDPPSRPPSGEPRPTTKQRKCLESLQDGSTVTVKLLATQNRLTGLRSWHMKEIGGCSTEGMDGGVKTLPRPGGEDVAWCPWMSNASSRVPDFNQSNSSHAGCCQRAEDVATQAKHDPGRDRPVLHLLAGARPTTRH